MKPLILTLLLSSLVACTQEHEFTVTLIKEMPKTADKPSPKKRYNAKVTEISGKSKDAPKRVSSRIEVYDIGATLDLDGNLVGPHKLYRVVETSKWVFAPHEHKEGTQKPPTPLKPKKEIPENRQVSAAVPQEAPRTPPVELSNAVASDPSATPVSDAQEAIRRSVVEGINSEPVPAPSPSGTEALEMFSKQQ